MASDEPKDLPEEEDPFHYPLPYLVQTWAAYQQHGQYPDDGAFNDQDAVWTQDMRRINARYAVIFDRVLQEKYPQRGQEPDDGLFPPLTARDWRQIE